MIWAQFLGLICINLRFMRIFPQLHLILTLSSFDYRCECFGPSLRRKARSWAKLGQESSKTSQIGPKQEDPRQIPWTKRNSKRSIREATEPQWPEDTMVCLCSRNFSSSFAAVQFPACFSVLSCYFVLKRGVYLALLMDRIHRKLSFILKNSIEEVEGRRGGIKRKATYWRRIERSTSKHGISFLFSCSFFHFLHLVSISDLIW